MTQLFPSALETSLLISLISPLLYHIQKGLYGEPRERLMDTPGCSVLSSHRMNCFGTASTTRWDLISTTVTSSLMSYMLTLPDKTMLETEFLRVPSALIFHMSKKMEDPIAIPTHVHKMM